VSSAEISTPPLLESAPRFSREEAGILLRSLYGLSGDLQPLPSERDQNFAVADARRGKFVLKISRTDEDRGVLDFQNAAMAHLLERVVSLRIPRVVPSVEGRKIECATDGSGRGFPVRLVEWIDGISFGEAGPHGAGLLASLGRAMGEIGTAFADFTHPSMHRHLFWDLRHESQALLHLGLFTPERRRLIERFARLRADVRWADLRKSVIHGDANDDNVLVRHGRVSGLIDFGDMVHSAAVGDLAIACAYGILRTPDPLGAAATITAAYHERHPLTEPEIEALYALIVSRFCMSVCFSTFNAKANGNDAYLLRSQGPVWDRLEKLAEIPFDHARKVIREACAPASRTLASRRRLLGGSLRLSYTEPLHIVRGEMQYLFDVDGRRYLDAYNNVPHVGHCHPRVLRAAQEQMAVLNTNTRYLSDRVHEYGRRLVATLPKPLEVCFFVNSGSEANELALRLARAHTGQRDLVVLEQAYHGNTTTLVDISPYKHDGPGGSGCPPWVHVAALPDLYRGEFRREDPDAGEKYARSVTRLVESVRAQGRGLCGFIAESWPSVAGQMDFPPGYLGRVYAEVRAANGVCIADEVQTGYGRLGRHFWGFEAYGVVPDIVVLGKPIGNGHPIGAVVTTAEIAASFDNGMEFFSTFGGNTVSSAIGAEVLDVVRSENLQAHAMEVGEHLLAGLRRLKARHPIVGDVRGSGLFLGVELVKDRGTLEPATDGSSRVVNGMRRRGILLGTEGVHSNILKVRPPMPFTKEDGDTLLEALDAELAQLREAIT
jgi:4-aminobutyrate aminotransferase-like enzyme/Ser/Thr protein kinase RdoA (MazF antagonist)